jgi:hypothetical protein
MSSYNPFAVLASPASAMSSALTAPAAGPPSLGSKRPRLSSPPPLTVPQPLRATTPVPEVTTSTPVPEAIDYSVFDILNIFRRRWFINHDHLIANVLSATRDDDGRFVWVDFLPQFHTSLIKRMCTLLPPGYSIARGKKTLFVFLLEILTGEGPKPEVFWRARKKRSRASREVCLATKALTPTSAPPAPSLVPTMPLVPCAQSAPKAAPLPEVSPLRSGDDVSMGSRPATPTPLPTAPHPHALRSNADFLKSFPRNLNQRAPLAAWLEEAANRKVPLGHLITSIRTAGHVSILMDTEFVNFVRGFFPSLPALGKQENSGWD